MQTKFQNPFISLRFVVITLQYVRNWFKAHHMHLISFHYNNNSVFSVSLIVCILSTFCNIEFHLICKSVCVDASVCVWINFTAVYIWCSKREKKPQQLTTDDIIFPLKYTTRILNQHRHSYQHWKQYTFYSCFYFNSID